MTSGPRVSEIAHTSIEDEVRHECETPTEPDFPRYWPRYPTAVAGTTPVVKPWSGAPDDIFGTYTRIWWQVTSKPVPTRSSPALPSATQPGSVGSVRHSDSRKDVINSRRAGPNAMSVATNAGATGDGLDLRPQILGNSGCRWWPLIDCRRCRGRERRSRLRHLEALLLGSNLLLGKELLLRRHLLKHCLLRRK